MAAREEASRQDSLVDVLGGVVSITSQVLALWRGGHDLQGGQARIASTAQVGPQLFELGELFQGG